ncbi:MAG: ribonuclease P protein component [Bacteroidales bacterium]|jgi:ribonuclease P protein component|nr:ribonuclease P protein component [Bacteroidales bacterium]
MKLRHTFRKEERLKSSKRIKQLFASGNGFLLYPFRVNWQTVPADGKYPAKVLISASKKHFKKAVQRNRIKRICREAYRKNKRILYDELADKQRSIIFSLIYIGNEEETYPLIEKKIIAALHRLISEIANNPQQNTPVS